MDVCLIVRGVYWNTYIEDLLYECSCFIEFIKQVFRNKFNKFNNTGARMLDSIYHMTLYYLKLHFILREHVSILPFFTQRYMPNGHH